MKTSKIFVLIIASLIMLCFISHNIFPQSQTASFQHISTSNGFEVNPVTSIAQDSKSLMWFGTRNGLLRYDGITMKKVKLKSRENAEVKVDDIFDIEILRDGNVWIGMADGLFVYYPQYDSTLSFSDFLPAAGDFTKGSITCLKEDSDGQLWVGTRNGLGLFNPKTNAFERIDLKSGNSDKESDSINFIYESTSGEIWVCTDGGLHMLEKEAVYRSKAFRNNSSNPNSLIHNKVNSIIEDELGNYWVGTRDGLDYFYPESEVFKHFSKQKSVHFRSEFVRALNYDQEGRLWVGTFDGINILEKDGAIVQANHDRTNPNSISENKIRSLFTDDNGTVWVGSYYGGINSWSKKQLNFTVINESYGDKLVTNVVSSIVEDQNENVFFGTEGEGVSMFNPKKGTFTHINVINETDKIGLVKTLYLEDDDNLWIGTLHNGLIHFDQRNRRFTQYKHDTKDPSSLSGNSVLSITKDEDGIFWVGTLNNGLNRFDPASSEFTKPRLKSTSLSNTIPQVIRDLHFSGSGDLYMGTADGIYLARQSIKSGDEVVFKKLEGDKVSDFRHGIMNIYEDGKGMIWVSIDNLGLFKVVGERLEHVDLNQINSVYSIVSHGDDELWMSTEEGIVAYNVETQVLESYDKRDGVPPNEFKSNAGLCSSDGWIYFGGASGVTVFNPDELNVTNSHSPDVVIDDFMLFDQSITPRDNSGILPKSIDYLDKIILAYDQNIFTLRFALPNYINSDKNTYYYRLSGLDEKWTKTSVPTASFTLQRGGDYVFEVRGENHDGTPTTNITTLKIQLLNPPWRTWWAYLIYTLIIFASLYGLISMFKSRIKLQNQLALETREFLRQEEVNSQKLQFFTNISHEFRTPLTLISGPIQQLISNYKGSNSSFRQLLLIKKNVDQLFRLINELMDFRKLENKQMKLQAIQGDVVSFVYEIYLSFKQQADSTNYSYVFESEEESIEAYFDPDKLEKVFYNLISNAFKFTSKKGIITVRIATNQDTVAISVNDTGDGIPSDHLERIFDRFYEVPDHKYHGKFKQGSGIGLAIAKSVMDLHHGRLVAESTFGIGSKFTAILPLGSSHLREDELVQSYKNRTDDSYYKSINAPALADEVVYDTFSGEKQPRKDRVVLVVEDNVAVADFIYQILSAHYNVIIAPNGKSGFRHALADQPNLIISDVMMPEMDGIEFCSLVKGNINTSHIPFIILSARTSLIYKYNGLESGADEYLSKPFEVKELLLKCENIMNTHDRIKAKFIETGEFSKTDISVSSIDEVMMKKAISTIKENISNEFFNVEMLCEELGISRTLLFTKFKAWTNQTPNAYLLNARMIRAAMLIEQNKFNYSEVAYQVGFKDPNYFSKAFKKHHTLSPKSFAEKFTVKP